MDSLQSILQYCLFHQESQVSMVENELHKIQKQWRSKRNWTIPANKINEKKRRRKEEEEKEEEEEEEEKEEEKEEKEEEEENENNKKN